MFPMNFSALKGPNIVTLQATDLPGFCRPVGALPFLSSP